MNPEEVQIELAEKFELPCRGCPACRGEYWYESNQVACSGSGVRHPLRKFCPRYYYRGYTQLHVPQSGPYPCRDCEDREWLYNDSPGVLTEAIRKKGWYIHLLQMDDGDYIDIHVGETRKIIATVEADMGLRFPASLELAALRAVEAS